MIDNIGSKTLLWKTPAWFHVFVKVGTVYCFVANIMDVVYDGTLCYIKIDICVEFYDYINVADDNYTKLQMVSV